MTNQNNAAQRVLTDTEILAIGAMHGRPSVSLLPMFRAIESAVRSKLRAPVAGAQPAANGYICTVPDDCETLHWRGQILSMNELASVAQPAVGEEIHVHIEGRDVLTLPLASSGMDAPRFVVHVPAQPAAPQASEAVRSERDATGRTPTDYALEFAEYLARDVEYAMACLNSSQRANEALLDLTEEVATADAYQAAEDAAAQADEAFTEAITALQSAVFEFRKRRDRAALSAQPGAPK